MPQEGVRGPGLDPRIDPSILDGTVQEVVGVSSRIIRVFLSSTFSDFTEERNVLLKDVYPKLQDYSKQKYGVNFQMVDMRWGVTNEAQNDHMTSACCLKEIQNCINVSVGPNFVALIGQKYGYRPVPAFIDAEELDHIKKLLENHGQDTSLLDIWYLKDENAVPAQCVLQPINTVLKNYDSEDEDLKKASRDEWNDTFEEIRELLMEGATLAFDAGSIGGQTKEKYFSSVTQEEIEHGILQNSGDPNTKCLCFVRHIENLDENINHHRAVKFTDVISTGNGIKVDSDAQALLRNLRDDVIPRTLNSENIVKLNTPWSDRGGVNSTDNAEYLDKLSKVFLDKMIALIDKNLADRQMEDDAQMKEIKENLKIRDEWSRIFFGRDDVLKAVEKYLKDGKNRSPYVLYGESGCGKTAVIAKSAKQTIKWLSDTRPVIIVRFLGTSPQTSHILLTLLSLCTQICDVYGMEKSKIPSEYNEVVQYFHQLLQKIADGRRLVIYLDSIDQLARSFDPHSLKWLPKELPKNVKIVISMIPSVNNLLKRFQKHVMSIGRESNVQPIPQLTNLTNMDIIHARLNEAERKITPEQTEILTSAFASCGLPLFSRILFEEVLHWKSYSSIRPDGVATSMREALNHFFQRLEAQHGRTLIRHALAYITASKDGLSEIELLDLLALDDEVLNSVFLFWLPPIRRLPPFLWTRLRLDLDVFLVTRDAGNQEVFTWYHRLFKEAAIHRYLGHGEILDTIHRNIAEYFMGIWFNKEKKFEYSSFLKSRLALTQDEGAEERFVMNQPLAFVQSKGTVVYNKRKLVELPYHLAQIADFENLQSICIFNYTWLWTKISAFGLQLLLEDLDYAYSKFEDNEISTLMDALRIAGSSLSSNPNTLALEITGRLIDLIDTLPKIKELVRQCDVESRSDSGLVSPFQLYDIPVSALTMSLDSSNADVGDMVLMKRATELAVLTTDGKVTKWDLEKGTVLAEIELSQLKSMSYRSFGLYISPDERFLVCESRPNCSLNFVIDSETFQVLYDHKMSSTNLNHNVLVSKRCVVIDNAIFHVKTGKKVKDLNQYRKLNEFVTLAFTVCENYLLMGCSDSLDMYSVGKAKRIKTFPLSHSVSAIQVTRDGRLAIVGLTIDCTIKLFDINTESNTFGQEIVTYDTISSFPEVNMSSDNYATNEVSEICISNKQRMFVSLVKRKYPVIWSLQNVSNKPRYLTIGKGGSGPLRYLYDIQFSSDDKYVVAAELSPRAMVWDTITGTLLATFEAHANDIHHILLSPYSLKAVTMQQNGSTINVWDIEKVLKMEKMSSRKTNDVVVKGIAYSKNSNLLFISKIIPPRNARAYHFIDYYGIDVLDLASGSTTSLLPFDNYGSLQTLTVSKDASEVVTVSGSTNSSIITVLVSGKLVGILTISEYKGVKLSSSGKYMSVFSNQSGGQTMLYSVNEMKEIDTYNGCTTGRFTKTDAFVGVSERVLLIRESMQEKETLKINLPGDVTSVHYSDVTEVLLVTIDDGILVSAMAFKTEGFGVFGTISNVSKGGISDIAGDGSICVDTDLQIFELQRCKLVKKLLPNYNKTTISCIRLSDKGEHVVFIDTNPTDCVKVCRVDNSQIIATCLLHTVPETIQVVPSLNVIIVIGKNRNLHILALRDCDRNYDYATKQTRARTILGMEKSVDLTTYETSEKVRQQMKDNAKTQKMRNLNVDLGLISNIKVNGRHQKAKSDNFTKGDNSRTTSNSCVLI